MVVTSFVSAEASATDETEDRRLRDMEACDWSIVRMETADWLIATELLRLRLGRVEFRPETGGELPRVKLGREGEPDIAKKLGGPALNSSTALHTWQNSCYSKKTSGLFPFLFTLIRLRGVYKSCQ